MKMKLLWSCLVTCFVAIQAAASAEIGLLFPLTEPYQLPKTKTAGLPSHARPTRPTNASTSPWSAARRAAWRRAISACRSQATTAAAASFTFPVKAAAAKDGAARATEHYYLDAGCAARPLSATSRPTGPRPSRR